MRSLLFACIVAFSSPSSALVAEAVSGNMPAATLSPITGETPAPILEAAAMPLPEAGVIITPVPMPASVIEVLEPVGRVAKLRPGKRPRLAKQKSFPRIRLSRTERHQFALLAAASAKSGELSASLRRFLHDENNESTYDELVLQRFYSRPRVAGEPTDKEESADTDDLSATVKLRLLLARLKAVEAHALAQVVDPGDELPDAIQQRLAAARQMAVAAHRRTFS